MKAARLAARPGVSVLSGCQALVMAPAVDGAGHARPRKGFLAGIGARHDGLQQDIPETLTEASLFAREVARVFMQAGFQPEFDGLADQIGAEVGEVAGRIAFGALSPFVRDVAGLSDGRARGRAKVSVQADSLKEAVMELLLHAEGVGLHGRPELLGKICRILCTGRGWETQRQKA